MIFKNVLPPIFAALIISGPLSAGATKTVENPNAVALSKAMLPEAHYKQMTDAIVQTGMGAARAKIDSDKLKIDLDKQGKDLENALRESFTYEYFIDLNSKTMSKSFTEKELGEILAFYTKPVGKKWTKSTPEIINETMMQIQLDLQEKLPQMVESLVKE